LPQIFVVAGPPIAAEMDLVMPYLLRFDVQIPSFTLTRENAEATGTGSRSATSTRKAFAINVYSCWYGNNHVYGHRNIVHARIEYEDLNKTVLVRRDLVINRS
jgi:hypothetical protein